MDSQEHVSRYAILIGIDGYSEKPLKSCVRDVQGIQAYLESESKEHIKIKLITAPSDDPMLRPTRKNFISAIERVTLQAKTGDFVYIHYSGHGTQKPPCGEFSDKITGDLALVLLSETENKSTCLWGFELAGLLKAMVDKGLVVTLVLDCCFSASVYRRHDPAIRFLDYDPKLDSAHPLAERSPGVTDGYAAYRDASMRSNWLVDPEGYTILTACGPREETGGYTFNGQNYGALSYFIIAILKSVGLTKTHKELHHYLCAKFRGHGIRQTTMLYGNKNRGFFGPVNSEIAAAITSVTKRNDVLLLEAGKAHGINDGDRFIIFPMEAGGDGLESQSPSEVARVIHARGLTSVLEQEQSRSPVQTGWMARIEAQVCLRNYPILLGTCLPDRNDWLPVMETRSLYALYGTEKDPFTFRVVMDDDKQYKIFNNLGREIINLPSMPQAQTNIGQVVDVLEHLARFRLARDLANDACGGPFLESFDVHICANGNIVSPNTLVEVKDGTRVQVVIKNNSEGPIYAFIYNFGPLWQVKDIYHGTLDTPQGVTRRWLQLSLPIEMREKGFTSCDDIVKVVLTSRPTSFDMLELPKLSRDRVAREPDRSGQGDSDAAEEWATMSFLFRTIVS